MFRKLLVAFCLCLSICSPLRGADSRPSEGALRDAPAIWRRFYEVIMRLRVIF
jgi:hypothetical protein